MFPPVAQQTIGSMKDALAGFIDAYLRCLSSEPDSAKMGKELSTLADAFEMPRGQLIPKEQIPPDFRKFGFELYFDEEPAFSGCHRRFLYRVRW